MSRISSLDDTYRTGDLSAFSSNARTNTNDPRTTDSKDTLYEVSNNAETRLKTGLSYNAKAIIVHDTSSFPNKGIIRIGPQAGEKGAAELVYYGKKTASTFSELSRGFAGSRQNQWNANSWVTNAVTAEPHNAVKDAIINIENKIGTLENPADSTLHKRLRSLEARFLAPKASFRAFPQSGVPGISVRFQNFSEGDIIRYLWDFGDGTQSGNKNPQHTYQSEGLYTVKLSVITNNGAQGIYTKSNYIKISEDEVEPFFYTNVSQGISIETSQTTGQQVTTFVFVDQTDGDIKQRFWIFGDGTENSVIDDPNVHEISHEYQNPGEYNPSLLIIFANESIKRVFLKNTVIVE